MSEQAKKQPVKRLYLIGVILMLVGVAKFPWGGQASVDPMHLVVSVSLIALSVACFIRGRKNRQESQA